ncbi:MAG: DUF3990 domain-containing protein [Mogibacterium sp.]|nr:DUF3990 domain-containing protein [Mogibacterium sp.]
MGKKIYHGGEKIVRSPAFGTGRQYNDFGLGFYCTEYHQYAAEWAVGTGRNGFVSSYSLESDGLRIINLCSSQYNPLHWLGLLFNYREFNFSSDTAYRAREYINKYFSVDHQSCDCIIGYRADNRCFMFAQDFLDAKLSYKSFRSALAGDNSNRQFVLKSNRAFDNIIFTGYEPALGEVYFPVRRSRELRSMKSIKSSSGRSDFFITDLIEEEVRPYDARLR